MFGQQILILDPPTLTLDFLVCLGLNLHHIGELWRGRGSIGPATNLLCHGQKRDYLSRTSQRARGATKNQKEANDKVNKHIHNLCTLCLKNDTDVAHYNFNAYQQILVIFGRDVANRVH